MELLLSELELNCKYGIDPGSGEDCVKRDVRKAGEEEDWKKKTRDRGGWKRLSDEAVKKLRAAPHP